MADVNPEAFKKVDLLTAQPFLKMSDWEKLSGLQNKIINGETDSPQDRTMRAVRKTLRAAVESAFPIKRGAGVTKEEMVAATAAQNEKLYDMEEYMEKRFTADANHLAKLSDPAARQKYINEVLYDAFREYDLNDGWFSDTKVPKYQLPGLLRDDPKLAPEETAVSRERFEERTGVPADAPRAPNGSIVVRDLAAIDKILRKAGERPLPRVKDDGRKLESVNIRTDNSGRIIEINPQYTTPEAPEPVPVKATSGVTTSSPLSQMEAELSKGVRKSLMSDPLVAWAISSSEEE
jgi:hypothetical protein